MIAQMAGACPPPQPARAGGKRPRDDEDSGEDAATEPGASDHVLQLTPPQASQEPPPLQVSLPQLLGLLESQAQHTPPHCHLAQPAPHWSPPA